MNTLDMNTVGEAMADAGMEALGASRVPLETIRVPWNLYAWVPSPMWALADSTGVGEYRRVQAAIDSITSRSPRYVEVDMSTPSDGVVTMILYSDAGYFSRRQVAAEVTVSVDTSSPWGDDYWDDIDVTPWQGRLWSAKPGAAPEEVFDLSRYQTETIFRAGLAAKSVLWQREMLGLETDREDMEEWRAEISVARAMPWPEDIEEHMVILEVERITPEACDRINALLDRGRMFPRRLPRVGASLVATYQVTAEKDEAGGLYERVLELVGADAEARGAEAPWSIHEWPTALGEMTPGRVSSLIEEIGRGKEGLRAVVYDGMVRIAPGEYPCGGVDALEVAVERLQSGATV